MKRYLLLAVLLSACSTVPNGSVTTTGPQINESAKVIPTAVEGSKCSKYYFKDRGYAPIGYLKGMAASYQRSLCRLKGADSSGTPAIVMSQKVGELGKDVFATYGIKCADPAECLRKNYTLLIGLGMRESSGWYGTGRDASADNVSSDTAESGLFQFSYNMHSRHPMLDVLYKEYIAKPEQCMVKLFEEGKNPKKAMNTKYWSLVSENAVKRDAGLKFQKVARECPAFAAEYTAVGSRIVVNHWGPIKRKEAEYRQECEDMLKAVEAATVCAL